MRNRAVVLFQRFGLILLFLAVSPVPLRADDELVAKVGSVPVTRYELAREQNKLLPLNASFHSGISQEKLAKVREEALGRLIERGYRLCYAGEVGLKLENGVLDQRMEQLQKGFPSYKEFKKATGKEGVAGVRASLERELLAAMAEKVAVDDKVQVVDAEVKAYYEKNRAAFIRPKQFRASHIVVRVDPASNKQEREALQKQAQQLAARAKAGEDFYNLAYYNSDKSDKYRYVGGDLGSFHEGQISRDYQQVLDKLKPGEISEPFTTRMGYVILKLVEVNAPRQYEFDEVKDKIAADMKTKQREALYAAWMAGLKKKYQVTRF